MSSEYLMKKPTAIEIPFYSVELWILYIPAIGMSFHKLLYHLRTLGEFLAGAAYTALLPCSKCDYSM